MPPVKKNSIQLSFGWMHSRLIDDGYARNLLFRGTNSKLGLGYSRETSKYLLRFSLEGSAGKVKSKSSDLPSNFYTAQVSLDYLRSISNYELLGKQNQLFIGPGASSMNYFMINQPIFDNARLLSLHGLYVNVSNRLQLDDKRHLQLTYRLPAAVYVNRLLWNGGASELNFTDVDHPVRALTTNGSFTYVDILGNIQFNVDYGKSLGKGADFVVSYRFRYFSDAAGYDVNIYSNELLLGLKILF